MMRSYLASMVLIALAGCYIPSGLYRITHKVTHVRPDGVECDVDLTKKRPDGWTGIPPCEDKYTSMDPLYGPGHSLKGASRPR